MKAYFLGRLDSLGYRVYRWNVIGRQSSIDNVEGREVYNDWITSPTAGEAIEYAQQEFEAWEPTEWSTTGPRGGKHERYQGWQSLVGLRIIGNLETTYIRKGDR